MSGPGGSRGCPNSQRRRRTVGAPRASDRPAWFSWSSGARTFFLCEAGASGGLLRRRFAQDRRTQWGQSLRMGLGAIAVHRGDCPAATEGGRRKSGEGLLESRHQRPAGPAVGPAGAKAKAARGGSRGDTGKGAEAIPQPLRVVSPGRGVVSENGSHGPTSCRIQLPGGGCRPGIGPGRFSGHTRARTRAGAVGRYDPAGARTG